MIIIYYNTYIYIYRGRARELKGQTPTIIWKKKKKVYFIIIIPNNTYYYYAYNMTYNKYSCRRAQYRVNSESRRITLYNYRLGVQNSRQVHDLGQPLSAVYRTEGGRGADMAVGRMMKGCGQTRNHGPAIIASVGAVVARWPWYTQWPDARPPSDRPNPRRQRQQ